MKFAVLVIFIFAGAISVVASRTSEMVKKNVKLGKYAAESGDYDRAVKHYKEALKASPKSKDILFVLGAIYQKNGEYDKAVNIYKKTIDLYPLDADAHLCLGALFLAQKKAALAIYELQKATELNPENSTAYRDLGYAQLIGGAAYSAAKSLERAVTLNTNDALIYFDLGLAYNKLGKAKKATRTFQKGLAIDNSLTGREMYTKVLEKCEGEKLTEAISDFNNNDFKKAKKKFKSLSQDYPDHALLYVYLGHTLHFKNPSEPFAAEMAYRKALKKLKYTILTPLQMAYLLDNLGMIRMNFGDYIEAEDLFRRAVDENTDYPVAYFNYGCMLAKRQQYDTAAVSFAAAAKYDKHFIDYVSSHAALNDFRKTVAYTNFLNSCKNKSN